jgi:hypothetical protein
MRLVAWQATDLLRHLDAAITVYGQAMGYPRDLLETRKGYVAAHAHRPDFRAVATLGDDDGGPVLVLTRARLRPSRAVPFWRAIGPVAAALPHADGLLTAFGIGEAPIGFQGTVSVWAGGADVNAFAYRTAEHAAVVRATPERRWYAEELFARLAVLDVTGDREVIGWNAERA